MSNRIYRGTGPSSPRRRDEVPLDEAAKAEVLKAIDEVLLGHRDVVVVWTSWLGQLGLLEEINRRHGDKIRVAYQKRKAIIYEPGPIGEGKSCG